MSALPPALQESVDLLNMIEDRGEKIQALISIAQRFQPVPPEMAQPPYPESHRVPGCESEVFVWARRTGPGWDFEFAVLNPQGLSAMALAVLLKEGLSGETAEAISQVPDEIVYTVFGRELSMGKSMGLMHTVQMCKRLAQAG